MRDAKTADKGGVDGAREGIPPRRVRGPVSIPPPAVYIAGVGVAALLEMVVPTPDLPRWRHSQPLRSAS